MKIKFIIMGGALLLMASLARADISIAAYRVDGFDSNNLEIGATFRVTIKYTNATGADKTLVGAKFYFNYDTTYVDDITEGSMADNLAGSLTSKTIPDFTPSRGNVRYQRDAAGGAGLPVKAGASVDCFTVTFHVKQDSSLGGKTILSWLTPIVDNVKLVIAGGENVAGAINPFPSATLTASAKPTFGGINSVTDPTTGNTLNLDWKTNGGIATDLSAGAATYYDGHTGEHNGKGLRYNLYRDTTPSPATKIVSEHNSFTYTNTGLNDTVTYYYTVRSQDDCTPTHNEDANTTVVSGTPHDYTPPSPPADVSIAQGDSENILTWKNPGGDFAGVIVARKPDGSPPSPSLKSASGNEDGATYNVGDKLSDGSIVKYKGAGESFTDTGLTNGVVYNYNIYAFDPAGGSPKQQGNNYSKPAQSGKAPGVAPAMVENLRALADPNTGDITLKWTNPIVKSDGTLDPDKARGYGGSKVVYAKDFGKWKDITVDSFVSSPTIFKEVEKLIPDKADPTKTPSQESLTISLLSTTEVYYFKVFSFNLTPDPATRTYQSGAMVAALPLKGGGGIITTVTTKDAPAGLSVVKIELKKKAGGMGINSFGIPFDGPFSLYDQAGATLVKGNIRTLKDLIDGVNATGKKVIAASYWDEAAQKLFGATYDSTGKMTYSTEGFDAAAVSLRAGKGYYFSVEDNVGLVLKK
jgi:hypothetical protein